MMRKGENMNARELYEHIEFLTNLRKEFAEEREIWLSTESDTLRQAFAKDIEKRGIQCGQLDYYIRLFKERLEGVEI